MTVYDFNNNINILHNKAYYKSLKNKVWKIIQYHKKINIHTIRHNNYFNTTNILSSTFYSGYLRQLGIAITKFEDKCITIKYLEYELKLYIYAYDYDRTIRNLKFECSKYSVNDKIEAFLTLFIDENWVLIIDFIDNNETNNYFNVDKAIPNSLEVTLN